MNRALLAHQVESEGNQITQLFCGTLICIDILRTTWPRLKKNRFEDKFAWLQADRLSSDALDEDVGVIGRADVIRA